MLQQIYGPSTRHTVRWFQNNTDIIPPDCKDEMRTILGSHKLHTLRDIPVNVAYHIFSAGSFYVHFHEDVLTRIIEDNRGQYTSTYICHHLGYHRVDALIRKHDVIPSINITSYLYFHCTDETRRQYYEQLFIQNRTFLRWYGNSIPFILLRMRQLFIPLFILLFFFWDSPYVWGFLYHLLSIRKFVYNITLF